MENATVTRAQRASSEVVRHEDGMKASGILYPFLQIMDCVALDVDVAYSGTDQRRIYMLGRETLPRVGEEKVTCVFSPLLGGLNKGKMSASVESSKINVIDDPETVVEKMKDAYCPAGEKKNNSVLGYAKYLLFPVLESKDRDFLVERPKKYGGNLSYSSFEEMEQDFLSGELHPQDLKESMGRTLAEIMEPIRKRFEKKSDLTKRAYPDES